MRKLDTAAVFERLFATYREQFSLLAPVGLIVFVPVALIIGAVLATGEIALLIVANVVSFAATLWYQAMVVEAVHDIRDGRRDHTVGTLLRSVVPVIGPLVIASLLAGLGIALGLVLLIVPGLILLTWWSLLAPVIVIERRPALQAFGRSRELVRGNGWQVFGVIVVIVVIQLVVQQLLGAVLGGSFVGIAIGSLAVNVLVAPLMGIAVSLIYFDLRGDAPAPSQPGHTPVTTM
jgi:hypothetical protein